MTTIYLFRHGQYESPNHAVPYRLPGFHLSAKGVADVTARASELATKPIVAVYTSPMERTYETATILAKPFHLTPIVDDRLIELRSPAQGEKEGFVEARGGWGIYESPWYKEHGGESMQEVVARMQAAMVDFTQKHANGEVIVVSHGDPIMLLVAKLKGIPLTPEALTASRPYVPMAGGYRLDLEEGSKVTISPLNSSKIL